MHLRHRKPARKPRRSRLARVEPLELRRVLDSTVVFNEIMYNPAGDGTPEWIELYNQMAVNVDLSLWRLNDAVDYTFAQGTILAGGGYLVVAADPAALQAHTGYAGALGPFTGALSNSGERIELVNHVDRLMDRVEYGDDRRWTSGPDGSGATLAKSNPQLGSEAPESWTTSLQMGGSPGAANVPPPVTVLESTLLPMTATWKYDQSGVDLGTAWHNVGYNDAAWPSGAALLYVETAALPAPKNTPLTLGRRTYYFRTTFQFDGNLNGADLRLRHIIDDGAVFYLNGQELSYRSGMAAGAVNYNTFANVGIGDAALSGFTTIPSNLLQTGTNTMAVEVHQTADTSSDIVMGVELVLQRTIVNAAVGPPTVGFNEVAGALENVFRVEIRNNHTASQDLAGYVVAATGPTTMEYVIPAQPLAPGGYLALDESQLGFQPAANERLFLYAPGKTRVLDAVTLRDEARGRSPDGTGVWQYTSAATFGAANAAFDFHDEIVINEIMYHHRPTYAQAATYLSSTLLPVTASWRYNQAGVDLGTAWRAAGYDDTGADWASGGGLFYAETAALPAPKTTPLTLGRQTYYFRTTFNVAGDPTQTVLQLRHVVDDGAVFYLNGQEFYRFNIGAGVAVTYNTTATAVGDAVFVGPINLPVDKLVSGTNVLAVEVHQVVAASNDVVFGAEVTGLSQITPESPFTESGEEWIELYNRSNHSVDLSGWHFDDAIHYALPTGATLAAGGYLVVSNDPAALTAKYPGITAVGPFNDGLSNSEDRIVLEDPRGNVADEVHYYQAGRWAEAADGGGKSLELRNPLADNAQGEAWAASNELARTEWAHYTYTAIATAPVYDPVTNQAPSSDFRELRIGLADTGDVLLDNVSVIENPGGTNGQLVQNGAFTGDTVGGGADKWRLLGTHAGTHVELDPDNAANKVLRVVAQSKADYLDNLLETTTVGNAAIVVGRTYQISFDARWLSGSPQLRAELYYNRVVVMHLLEQPTLSGTPGAQNSTYQPNLGPTYSGLSQSPAVPAAAEPATVSIASSDPDGIASMTLLYSVAGGAWQNTPMTLSGGRYSGQIPGQAAAAVVQFYVQGQDTLGATSTFPADGVASRALIKWNDGQAQVGTRHNFRMIMTQADVNKLFLTTNMMSNERLGATIVYDETEVFYDVGLRQRGSMFSRGNPSSTGYNIKFEPDHLFRGVHSCVTMKVPGKAEILVRHSAIALGMPEMYDDMVYMNTPSAGVSGIAIMSMARYGDEFITTQYEDGNDGTVFKMQGVRVLLNNTGTESLKTYQPVGWIGNYDLTNLGSDKEQYRWSIQIMNNRAKDDYGPVVAALQALSLSGVQLEQAVDDVIDVDQWMRVFALQNLWGIGDAYMQGNPHNIDFFIRPSDGMVEVFPWDWNFVATYGSSSPLYGIENRNVTEVIDRPIYRRLYYGHMRDMILTKYNAAYMTQWATHYGQLAGEDYTTYANYITARGNYVLSQLNTLAPAVPFNVTTPNGQQVNDVVATITGDGWIDVREILVDGRPTPLNVTWTDFDSWQATIPIAPGVQTLTLRAINHQGAQVGTDTLTIESTVTGRPLQDHLRISELQYHPGDPTADELADGFGEADSFEFIELLNTGSQTLDLTGVRFTDGIGFEFTGSGTTSLAAGQRLLLVEDISAFQERFGSGLPVAGQYSGRLDNAGEHILLVDSLGVTIQDFTYDDVWYPSTDGDGPSLTIESATQIPALWNEAAGWRASRAASGSPGTDDLPPTAVVDRHVFYNNSGWDGNNAAANASDDAAIASDKSGLLPGQTATLANYTSYNKGLNGIMIDVAGLAGTITAADFGFRTGNVSNTTTWTALATAPSVAIRPGAGTNGSDRITLTWLDGTITKRWLQLTMLGNSNTGLPADDVFYFGNAVGEAGNSPIDAQVNAADELAARGNPRNIANPAPITFLFDYNRDKQVNAADQLISRGNPTNLASRLLLIAPTVGAGGPAAAALAEAALVAGEADGPVDALTRRRR